MGFLGLGCHVDVVDISQFVPSFRPTSGKYSVGRMMKRLNLVAETLVKEFKPDLLFTHHGRDAAHRDFLTYFRRRGIPTAAYFCDEPYECGETVKWSAMYDYAFLIDPCTMPVHQAVRPRGRNVFYLPPGVDVNHYRPMPVERDQDVLFLGNANLTPREPFLRLLEKRLNADIRFFGQVTKDDPRWVKLKDHPELFSRFKLGANPHRSPWMNEECWNKRVKSSKASPIAKPPEKRPMEWGTGFWNDANRPAAHVNPRFFAMAACGSVPVNCNTRSELARMFPEAPRADTPEDMLMICQRLLIDEDLRKEIASSCLQKIRSRHTYFHRVAEILIRLGWKDALKAETWSSLGEPQEWMTPQEPSSLGLSTSWEPTGPLDSWSPPSGRSSTLRSGQQSEDGFETSTTDPWF